MAWIMSALVVLTLLVGQGTGETYEQALNQGLKAEGLRQWPEAISFYVKAIQLDPNNSLPRERLISIFRELKSEGTKTVELEILLPEDLRAQLGKIGAIETATDQAAALKKMNLIFWSAVAGLSLLFLAGFIYLLQRKRPDDEDQQVFSTRSSQKKRSGDRPPSKNTGEVEKKIEVKVTEKTRQEMTGVIAGVKSITAAQKVRSAEELKAEVEALEGSEVLQALAQTMLSEISTEEAKDGRFSKMTIEAQLIFDETDLPPDLDDYRKEHGDSGIEDYLDRLASREAKKKK